MFNNYCRATSLPAIDSYEKAAAEWEKTKPIRGRAYTDKRPLGKMRAVDRFAIIKRGDSYALRYHNTDVVTYHADGSITLDYWASKSTDEFANRLLPKGVTSWFTCALGAAVILSQQGEDRLYLLGRNQHMVFDHGISGYRLEQPKAIEVYGIDRKAARAALKATRYRTFMHWLEMKENLEPDRARPKTPLHPARMLEYLDKGPLGWPALGEMMNVEDKLRNAIYAAAGDVVTCTELPYLTGTGLWGIYSKVHNIRAVNAKWQYL